MTKESAIQTMEQGGYKVAHRLFSENEFIRVFDENYLIDEEGLCLPKDDFWKYRQGVELRNNGGCKVMKKSDEILRELKNQHRYDASGDPDSYSDYNQGWQDALYYVGEVIEQVRKEAYIEAINKLRK